MKTPENSAGVSKTRTNKTPQKRNTDAKKPAGETQTEYRRRIMDIVCAITAYTEKGLPTIVEGMKKEHDNIPSEATIRAWMMENSELGRELAAKYARAKEAQVEKLVDQIIEISDDDSLDMAFTDDGKPYVDQQHIQRARLRVDSRKWIASKLKPKKYGDRVVQEVVGDPEAPLQVQQTVTLDFGATLAKIAQNSIDAKK